MTQGFFFTSHALSMEVVKPINTSVAPALILTLLKVVDRRSEFKTFGYCIVALQNPAFVTHLTASFAARGKS
jgi:hypothetical protein